MLVLGVESSCDETGAAVVDDEGRVLSDVVQSQVSLHAPYGGIVPELASRDHLRNIGPVVRAALRGAGIDLGQVDGVAVTNRPGLVGSLLVGVQSAKGMAWASGKPLVGVDHLMGHLLSVFLRREGHAPEQPQYPFVCLLASGGHTAIYRVDAPRGDAIAELGATRDDAAGEAFDKVAKLLGLGYPGGPRIDALAAEGDPSRVKLSNPMASRGSLEMSFSGIKTQVARIVAERGGGGARIVAERGGSADARIVAERGGGGARVVAERGGSADARIVAERERADARVVAERGSADDQTWVADVCAAFQTTVTTVLARKVIEAAEREGVREVVLGGGVAANRELRRRVSELGAARDIRVFVPPLSSCTDNAAMIAYAGAVRLSRGERDGWDLVATSQTVLERRTRKGRGRRSGE